MAVWFQWYIPAATRIDSEITPTYIRPFVAKAAESRCRPGDSSLRQTLMKIPLGAEIPRSCGQPPLKKGAIGGFIRVDPNTLQLISILYVVPIGT